jgi:parvulin-like peptidyl-prolyl isomerase
MSHNSRVPLTQKGIIAVIGLLFIGSGAVFAGNYAIQDYNTVLTVNQERVTKSDVARRNLQLQPFFKSSKMEADAQKEYIENELIERRLFVEAAHKEGVKATDAEIDAEWQTLLKEQYGGKEDLFERDLKRSSYTPRLFRHELAERILVRHMREQIQKTVVVSNEALRTHYAKHKNEYLAPERVSAQHILVHIDEEKPNGDAEALKKAQHMITELGQGKAFAELAKQSDDTTNNEQAGQLPLFTRGEMVPAFEKAVWAMKPGETSSSPVKTEFGYHIIRRGPTVAAGPKPFEEAKNIFEARLQAEAEDQALKAWLKKQRAAATILPEPEKK